jgi:hypothetical protein
MVFRRSLADGTVVANTASALMGILAALAYAHQVIATSRFPK